jgi:aspartate aminotransferase-like enzyme
VEYYRETADMIKTLFNTKNVIVPMVGTIRVAFDGIYGSILEPGDRVLLLSQGYWGGKFQEEVVRSFGGTPIIIEEQPGHAMRPEKVEEALKKEKDIKVVSVVHVETDGGIVNPVDEIGKVVKRNTDAMYMVDCATSFGGMKVELDKWSADIGFSGSHKGMQSPTGMAFIALGERAWQAIRNRKTPIVGHYNNLIMWRERMSERTYKGVYNPPPIPIPIIHALRARLDYIFKTGPEKVFRRHEIAARAYRKGLTDLGLKLLAESDEAPPCSNTVTTCRYPEGVSSENVEKITTKRYHIPLYCCSFRPETFMLGTINDLQVNARHILYVITALGLTMSELGVKIDLEKGIRTTNKILLDLVD